MSERHFCAADTFALCLGCHLLFAPFNVLDPFPATHEYRPRLPPTIAFWHF